MKCFAILLLPQHSNICLSTLTGKNKSNIKGVLKMVSSNRIENIARIVSYCKTSRRKAQIMREMNLNDLEIEAYTAILIRQRLLEQNFTEYRTTKQGNSYLDTRDRVEITLRK